MIKQIVPEVYVLHCEEAVAFYRSVFGGEIRNLKKSDELPLFQEYEDLVIHSELHIAPGCSFYFVDVLEEGRAQVGNVTLMLHMDSLEELRMVYEKLSHQGHLGMPLQQTPDGAWHAIVTDRFGAPWALHYTPEAVKR